MSTSTTSRPISDLLTTPDPDASAPRFADRLLAGVLGSMELFAVYLGDRLGWYRALRDHGPCSSDELAALTGTVERYAREWLEHQAASGYLAVEDGGPGTGSGPHARRTYRLAPGAAEVLTDVDSLLHLAPLARFVAAAGQALGPLLHAYRHGGGVSWAQLGADAREAQSAANRPMFLHELTQTLLPAVPDLHALLGRGARVADVGCGEGWSGIGLALGYGGVTVEGLDVDEPSVEAARRHAADHGVADRVTFRVVDAASTLAGHGPYDVVTAFECVHDLPDPVGVLGTMRRLAGDDGYVLVMDERAHEHFEAPSDPVERLLYGYSILVCLPDGLSHPGGVGTGTVMRPDVLREYARRAGFADVEVLPVEHDLFRFYRLRQQGVRPGGRAGRSAQEVEPIR